MSVGSSRFVSSLRGGERCEWSQGIEQVFATPVTRYRVSPWRFTFRTGPGPRDFVPAVRVGFFDLFFVGSSAPVPGPSLPGAVFRESNRILRTVPGSVATRDSTNGQPDGSDHFRSTRNDRLGCRGVDLASEFAAERDCLYTVCALTASPDGSPESMLKGVVETIPSGWARPGVACARIVYRERIVVSAGFTEREQRLSCPLRVQGEPVGAVEAHIQPGDGALSRPEDMQRLLAAVALHVQTWFVRRQGRGRSS